MHFRTLALFITLFYAANVHAYDTSQNQQCDEAAIGECQTGTGQAYDITLYKCLSKFWVGLTNNDKCPHTGLDCLCYNGCVKDRSGSVRDVGGWCTVACRQSLQAACHKGSAARPPHPARRLVLSPRT
ncbi:hypothetical protein V8E36_006873 [Tilletia maclaganii]